MSVGVVDGVSLLDLDYSEDSNADVDLNVVMTGEGEFVEVQATAERVPFDRARLDELLDLAAAGIADLRRARRRRSLSPVLSAVPALGDGDILLRLAVAAGLGAAIGVERELREREAGIRTHLIVAVGSALFTLVGAYAFHVHATSTTRASPRRSSPASASSVRGRSSAKGSRCAGSRRRARLGRRGAGMAAGPGTTGRRSSQRR